MPNPHGEFIWYELVTPDPDGAKRFYEAVLDWEVGPPSPDEIQYREIRAGDGHAGGMMHLSDAMRAQGARPIWLGYIGVDDVDASVASVTQGGGLVLVPAFDIPDIGRIAMVTDPQGVPFYVMRGAVEGTSEAYSPDKVGRCAWNELATSDPAAALSFYSSRFHWQKGETMPMGEMGDYQFITHHGRTIGAMMRNAHDRPARWRFYFRVADVDSARSAVEQGGGTVVHGPQEVPGGDRILIGIDPGGAEFALVGK